MRRLPLLLSLILTLLFTIPAQAAPADICFSQVPDCISGRFALYWRDNGGLPVFGLPLAPSTRQRVGDPPVTYLVQYFERARFELHPKEPKPYDVLLGRLGADQLAAQSRDWQTFPKADPSAPHYFQETGHAIDAHFWGFWSTHGLEFDGNKKAKSFGESLALFGLPISEPAMEQSSDGAMYLTQWFERARFEYHPENQPPYDVLLGLLGADVLRQQAASPAPAGLPGIPAPTGACVANAPDPAEGPQAWMTDPAPQAPRSLNSLCTRLIVNGMPVSGAQVSAVAHYSNDDVKYGPATTGADGVAEIGFNIGDARRLVVVPIDVTIKSPDGQLTTTTTDFRPSYPLSGPPVGGPPLPNIPAPTGNCVANAPPPFEGAQAWMTVFQPSTPGQFDSICARLIVNGAVVSGAEVNAIIRYPGKDKEYGPATTDANGVAELGFNIGDAHNHYFVFVDVTIKTRDDQTYETSTYFRPEYPQP